MRKETKLSRYPDKYFPCLARYCVGSFIYLHRWIFRILVAFHQSFIPKIYVDCWWHLCLLKCESLLCLCIHLIILITRVLFVLWGTVRYCIDERAYFEDKENINKPTISKAQEGYAGWKKTLSCRGIYVYQCILCMCMSFYGHACLCICLSWPIFICMHEYGYIFGQACVSGYVSLSMHYHIYW